jgi:hypothetical protein
MTRMRRDAKAGRLSVGTPFNDLAHSARYCIKHFSDLELPDRDVEHGSEIACHIHIHETHPVRELGTRQYCAQFNRPDFIRTRIGETGEGAGGPYCHRLRVWISQARARDNNGREEPMLVPVIKVAEITKNGRAASGTTCAGDSVVWLIPLNYWSVFRRNFTEAVDFALPSVFTVSDGERKSSRVLDLSVRVDKRQRIDEMVKSGTETMDAIAEQEAGPLDQRGQVRHVTHIDDVIARLFLILGSNPWEVITFSKRRADLRLESISMFTGPLDLRPSTTETHEVYSDHERQRSAETEYPEGARDSGFVMLRIVYVPNRVEKLYHLWGFRR